MRPQLVKTALSIVFTLALVILLAVPLGPFFSPVGGLWSAARDGRFRS